VHTRRTSANITPTLAGAVLLCLCAQARGQGGAQTQTFVIHGTPRTCTAITQLDSALLTDSPQFFAGWTESDYADAVAWSQACAEYGWQVPWHPRIPLLMSQHDRALKSVQTQTASSIATAGVLPNPPAQAATAPPVQVVPSAASAGTPPNLPVQAVPDQTEPSAASGSTLQGPPVQAANAAPAQVVPTAATVLSSAAVQTVVAPPVQAATSAATASVLPNAPAQAADAASQSIRSAATAGVLPTAAVQATIAAPAHAVPIVATDNVVPSSSVQAAIAAPAQAVPIVATGSALPTRIRDHMASDGQEDSLLADNYYKEHFHQESLWVASKANLDIGDDRVPSAWSSNGKPAQMKNRLTADRIVLYCARKTNTGESGKRPLLWDLRWCEAEEASAYNRLVSGNEFPTAGRAVVLGCAGVDSYVYLERCMATLTEAGMH
jgi:hypothetical protein